MAISKASDPLAKGGRGVLIERDRFGDGSVVDSFRVGATLQDTTPPTTTPQVVGNMGALGRYNGQVAVTFAADDADGVGVEATYYALDDGPWVQYRSGVPLVISAGGTHRIDYYSVDFFGNTEATQQLVLRINYPPSADAGPDQTVRLGSLVTLDGSNSADPDPSPSSSLSFAWTQTAGPDVALTGANSAKPTFTPPVKGAYTFSLTVNDGQDDSVPDEVTITVLALGDLDGDGTVNCADIAIVKASFGKRTGQPGFDPRADVTGDGVVDIRDLSFVSRQLPAGTTCK
jgi:hypothetical protein